MEAIWTVPTPILLTIEAIVLILRYGDHPTQFARLGVNQNHIDKASDRV